MAVVLIAAVSYQCAATWRWLKSLTGREPTEPDPPAITKQSSIRISHSLPDLQKDSPQVGVAPEKETKNKVLRQTTLPTVPSRHQTFQRQLVPCVPFSICRLEDKSEFCVGLIKVIFYVTFFSLTYGLWPDRSELTSTFHCPWFFFWQWPQCIITTMNGHLTLTWPKHDAWMKWMNEWMNDFSLVILTLNLVWP